MRVTSRAVLVLLLAGLLTACGSRTFRGVEEDVRAVGAAVGKGVESVGQSIQRGSAGAAPDGQSGSATGGADKDKGGAAGGPAPAKE